MPWGLKRCEDLTPSRTRKKRAGVAAREEAMPGATGHSLHNQSHLVAALVTCEAGFIRQLRNIPRITCEGLPGYIRKFAFHMGVSALLRAHRTHKVRDPILHARLSQASLVVQMAARKYHERTNIIPWRRRAIRALGLDTGR